MGNNSLAIRLYPEVLRSLAFGSISGTYAAIGTAFLNPCRILEIINTTDADMLISYDGTHNHDVVPAHSGKILDFCANQALTQGAFLAEGTIVYVAEVSAPTLGSVYVATYYGVNPYSGVS
jgi:hypothetical protein